MDELFLVWYKYSWADFDDHCEKKLVGVFDTIEKAEKERFEWETLAEFHLFSEGSKTVEIQKVKINTEILTQEEANAWY